MWKYVFAALFFSSTNRDSTKVPVDFIRTLTPEEIEERRIENEKQRKIWNKTKWIGLICMIAVLTMIVLITILYPQIEVLLHREDIPEWIRFLKFIPLYIVGMSFPVFAGYIFDKKQVEAERDIIEKNEDK